MVKMKMKMMLFGPGVVARRVPLQIPDSRRRLGVCTVLLRMSGSCCASVLWL